MSRVCQVSGVGPMKGHRRRHPHSGAWNLRAPKKNHTFVPNLQQVTIRAFSKATGQTPAFLLSDQDLTLGKDFDVELQNRS